MYLGSWQIFMIEHFAKIVNGQLSLSIFWLLLLIGNCFTEYCKGHSEPSQTSKMELFPKYILTKNLSLFREMFYHRCLASKCTCIVCDHALNLKDLGFVFILMKQLQNQNLQIVFSFRLSKHENKALQGFPGAIETFNVPDFLKCPLIKRNTKLVNLPNKERKHEAISFKRSLSKFSLFAGSFLLSSAAIMKNIILKRQTNR